MITYIINTSENKTFDTEKIFSLTGYMKIVWINSRLDEIEKCTDEIESRQNVLGAEDFRIAVIVDFYNFNHIRLPYAETGYSRNIENEGVDLSLYFPFIECYIIDNLFEKINQRNLFISQRDIYYVQNENFERLENIDNAEEQLKRVLEGKDGREISEEDAIILERERSTKVKREVKEKLQGKLLEEEKQKSKNEQSKDGLKKGKSKDSLNEDDDQLIKDIYYYEVEEDKYTEEEIKNLEKSYIPYNSFSLKCTESMELEFKMTDYPYSGTDAITLHDFFNAIISRHKKLNTHFYPSSNSRNPISAAYDTLNLSLYLIEMYEHEQTPAIDGRIPKIDPIRLKDVLIRAWNKVCKAQSIAKENETKYLDVNMILEDEERAKYNSSVDLDDNEEKDEEIIITSDGEEKKRSLSIDELYEKITKYSLHTEIGMNEDDIKTLNKIIKDYLVKRDFQREQDLDVEFETYKKNDDNYTLNCPPQIVYEKVIEEKEEHISSIFKNTLKSEYINVNYEEEKKTADILMMKYDKLREYKSGKPVATIIFNILVCLIMIVPYAFIQRKFEGLFEMSSIFLYLFHLGFFVGILFLSFTLLNMFVAIRIAKIKKRMRKCLNSCNEKKQKSMSLFKKRYTVELLEIEEARYVIREVKKLNNATPCPKLFNLLHLSSILNNLGIEPIIDKSINIDNEFNIDEPIKSAFNKVYKVFDIDTIEDLFARSGGNNDGSY